MNNCNHKHEFKPVSIAAGTELPINIYIYFSIGKYPIITSYVKASDGSRTQTPLVTATTTPDAEGYVKLITINPAPGEDNLTTEDIEVNIYPQNIE